MCGIAGIIRLDGQALSIEDAAPLGQMAAQLRHRGPDDEQFLRDGPVALAFRRLSIVDLAGGAQPFFSEDRQVAAIANGEIYNHREAQGLLREPHAFRSSSDCEVLVHLYEERGPALLELLEGMYAFALWDRRQQRVLLGRDRLGIKPLFFARVSGLLLFASELKSLFEHPKCPRAFDWRAALGDPLMSRDPALRPGDPSSFFEGIEQLPGGCSLSLDLRAGTVTRHRYWELPTHAAEETEPDAAVIERYGELLRASVQQCLMSDVEYGLFLSGGIDSSAIAALAAPAGAFHTFSVLSQSTFAGGDAEFAHRLARRLELPNHQVLFDWHALEVGPEAWKSLLWLCETPFCGPEQLYKFHLYRSARAARPGLKVMLIGQGSDEFNGGYSTMLAPPGRADWPGLVDTLAACDSGRLYQAGAEAMRPWGERFGEQVLQRDYLESLTSGRTWGDVWDVYLASSARDLQNYNLWHEDRTAAGNHVENRVPFLDHRLVECAARLAPSQRARLLWDKRILREAMAPHLSEPFRERPKVPFFAGKDAQYTYRMMVRILESDGGALLDETFATGSRAGEVLDEGAVRRALREVSEDPQAEQALPLMHLVNMGLLERMAHQLGREVAVRQDGTLPEIVIDDWDREAPALALRLAARRQIDAEAILAFVDGVSLVRPDGAHPAAQAYLVVNDRIEYVLSEEEAGPWLQVLRRIDGQTRLGSLLEAAGVHESEIRKHLEEAIDFEVVQLS